MSKLSNAVKNIDNHIRPEDLSQDYPEGFTLPSLDSKQDPESKIDSQLTQRENLEDLIEEFRSGMQSSSPEEKISAIARLNEQISEFKLTASEATQILNEFSTTSADISDNLDFNIAALETRIRIGSENAHELASTIVPEMSDIDLLKLASDLHRDDVSLKPLLKFENRISEFRHTLREEGAPENAINIADSVLGALKEANQNKLDGPGRLREKKLGI